jgi:large subunit ribosomal protein L29
MAIIKKKQLKEMSEKDLEEKLKELKLELSKDLASSEVGGTVKNPGRIRETRKTIAKILTIKNERKRDVKKKNA